MYRTCVFKHGLIAGILKFDSVQENWLVCTTWNRPHAPHSSTQTAEQTTTPKFLHLPYVRGVSERIERKCRRLGIRTTFKSNGTLREALVQTKDPQPEWKKKGVVYQVPCAECESVYIGETGRTLEKRISEHVDKDLRIETSWI